MLMRKLSLVGFLVLSLVLGMAAAALADSGFYLELGYGKFDNETEVSGDYNNNDSEEPTYGDGSLKILSPGSSYLLELGYAVNDNWSFLLNYNWGSNTLVDLSGTASATDVDTSVTPIVTTIYDYTLGGKLKLETEVANLETKYQWGLGRGFKLAGIVGYSAGTNTVKVNGNYTQLETDDSGTTKSSMNVAVKLEQEIHAPYIGGQISYAPMETLELGVAGRYLIDPSDKVKVNYQGAQVYNEDLTDYGDFDSWKIDLYGIATLSEKWSLKVNYSINYTCYEITGSDIRTFDDVGSLKLENTTRLLTASLRYKF
jgi:hypothetical protein